MNSNWIFRHFFVFAFLMPVWLHANNWYRPTINHVLLNVFGCLFFSLMCVSMSFALNSGVCCCCYTSCCRCRFMFFFLSTLLFHWVFVFVNLFTSFVHCLLCFVACCVSCQYVCSYSVSSFDQNIYLLSILTNIIHVCAASYDYDGLPKKGYSLHKHLVLLRLLWLFCRISVSILIMLFLRSYFFCPEWWWSIRTNQWSINTGKQHRLDAVVLVAYRSTERNRMNENLWKKSSVT